MKRKGWTESSVQTHSREERNCAELRGRKEPLKVLLKDTFTRATMLTENSIEAGFGSVRTPPTIEQFDPSFTNSGDQIAVQVNIRNVGAVDDFGVCHLKIFASGDGGIHQTFDLTHERGGCRVN